MTTIPGAAQTPDLLALCADVPAVFEVVYDPWPTPLARAVLEDGRLLVAGLDLLAHQAVGQVQRMTGQTVSVDLLRQAGTDELTRRAVQINAGTATDRLAFAHGLARSRTGAGRRGVPGRLRGPRLVRPDADRPHPRAGARAGHHPRRRERPGAAARARAAAAVRAFAAGGRREKVLYAEIAAAPHLGWWTAAWAGLFGAAFGASLGWTGALLYLVPLVPIGVALMIVDWRTTLLPTRVIHPTYVLLAVLIPLAALIDGDLDSLYRAGWGWLIIGAWFWVFWWLFNAWGFGDVRLARVLGPALGYLGWYELLMGLALILLVGGLGGLVLGIMTRDLRRRVPYGPFMLIGSALSVVIGPWLAQGLGY